MLQEAQIIFKKQAQVIHPIAQHRQALYTLYKRALRRDPTLAGRIVFALTIEPSGRVSRCTIVSSELKNPRLERRLRARIRSFDFGAEDVPVLETRYPLEFLPGSG